MQKLNELADLPAGLLELDATRLHAALGGPTLIHLPGRRQPAVFASVLLHGNEVVGWEALRQMLRNYQPGGGDKPLPRDLSIFIGNTDAARVGLRRLEGQPDYNRVWPGSETAGTPEHRLMAEVVDSMARRGVFVAVDLHNNTGLNPHYACVNVIQTGTLHLAALFGRTVVYFIRPTGVASMAMAELCPAVTLECGKVGDPHGVEHARDYLDACLHLAELPSHPVSPRDIDLFHTVAIVRVPAGIEFGSGCEDLDLCLNPALERLNFRELPAGTSFGWVSNRSSLPVDVRNELDHEVSVRYFEIRDHELLTRTPLMPSMLTLDTAVIRQDCLCYLMERYDGHLSDAHA